MIRSEYCWLASVDAMLVFHCFQTVQSCWKPGWICNRTAILCNIAHFFVDIALVLAAVLVSANIVKVNIGLMLPFAPFSIIVTALITDLTLLYCK